MFAAGYSCSSFTQRLRDAFFAAVVLTFVLICARSASAAISSAGDIFPVPPAAGGSIAGPFRIGNVDVGTMSITGGTALSNTGPAVLGDTVTGIGIVNMNGFGSDWTLTSSGADFTVANNGTGSLNLSNLAFLSVNDDLFVASQLNSLGEISISGLGTIMDVGDDAIIGQRGQAVIEISNGGRLVTDANIIGDEAAGDGRVIVADQFSMWRTFNTMIIADAGRALLQIFDGGRVENTSATIANQAGSTGTVEVVGLGSIWQNSRGLVVGDFGNGQLIVGDGGRVMVGTGANLFTIGRQIGSIGQVEVRGIDSYLSAGTTEVGDSGDGTLRILAGGRVTSSNVLIGDNSSARGRAIIDGPGSSWEVAGEINVSDPGEAHLTVSEGGLARSGSITRVNALGRVTLDGGRLEVGSTTTGLLNTGVIDGNGTIEVLTANNNAGGRIRPQGAEPLLFTGTLNNAGTVDVQSGILEVVGPTNNNVDIDARDGAVLRFGGAGLNNNSGAQLAITSGIVDVFGTVSNNTGAEIDVGGSAVAVFHDAVTNNGTIFIQPGGEILMLENLSFTPSAALHVGLQAIDETGPSEPSDGFGQVQVSGAAALAGTLGVSLLGGYLPAAGDSFQLLTAVGGLTGAFSTELLPTLPGGLDWNVQYNPDSVVLSVIAPLLPGDYNADGIVDAADYVMWRKDPAAFGGDPAGYNTWRANFGRTAGGGADAASAAVPEPTSLVLLWIAAAVFLVRRHPRACG